jgi:hypothetical protein
MKLRIGDKVRVLNEVGEGIVSRIRDKDTVFVEMSDGFEIPYREKELVPIHTDLIRTADTDNIELDPEAAISDAVYFVIEPDHELPALVSDYKIYLFNASSFHLLYAYSVKDEAYYQTLKQGDVGAYQKVLLRQVKMDFFRNYTHHKIECLLYKNSFFKAQTPIAEVIRIDPRVIAAARPISHEEFRRPVYAFLLKDDFIATAQVSSGLQDADIDRLKAIKEFVSRPKSSKSSKEYLRSLEKEVDLHINELLEDTKGLSNYEMLTIQLERFEKELDAAIASNVRKITFIHGVGNGRLKQEITAILRDTPGVTFFDAPYKEYGYGATQVNIL